MEVFTVYICIILLVEVNANGGDSLGSRSFKMVRQDSSMKLKRLLSKGGKSNSFVVDVHTSGFSLQDLCVEYSRKFKLKAIWDSKKTYPMTLNGTLTHIEYSMQCYKPTQHMNSKAVHKIGVYGFNKEVLLEIDADCPNCNTYDITSFVGLRKPVGECHRILVISKTTCVEYEICHGKAKENLCPLQVDRSVWEKTYPPKTITKEYLPYV